MILAAQLPGAAAAAEPQQYFLNYIRIFGALRKLMVDPGYIGSGAKRVRRERFMTGKKGLLGKIHGELGTVRKSVGPDRQKLVIQKVFWLNSCILYGQWKRHEPR